jgi:serine/threonine protein kinase
MTPARGHGPEDGWLSDAALDRLRAIDDRPDLGSTRYELLDEIGHGGMGIVFRGRDRELDREVAIKVTAWPTGRDAERLRCEARTLAALEHPGIVPVHDVGRLPDGRLFTVMTLVRGERLDARARRLPLPDRLRLFDRVCETVSFAHARGVIHRDLKPANVMVGTFGQVFVLDWGGGFTPGYMAPEQALGAADGRADVFALGALLGDLIGAADQPRLRPLRSIVARATESNPASRYPTAAELAAEVRRYMDGAAVTAHRETAFERGARLARVYRAPIGLVLAYLVMRTLVVFFSR